MKSSIKYLAAIAFCLSLLVSAKAQDNGTFVDEGTVQDSTYVDDIFMDDEQESGSNNNIVLYIVGAAVVIGGGILVGRKMKK